MSDARPSVLVVDDDAAVADAYRLLLDHDYDVTVATRGGEALGAIDETTDVMLLDREMPDVSGDEVLQRIRNHGYDCAVALVTATELTERDDHLPFDAYLTKPVDKATLRSAVSRLVSLDTYESAPDASGAVEVGWGGNVVRTDRGWEQVS